MHVIYAVLYGSVLIVALPYFFFRSLREPGYGASLVERLGLGRGGAGAAPAAPESGSIWIHAVSVGEVVAAATLVPGLRRAFPGKRLVCSVTTTTGRQLARDKLKAADEVFYCPFDLPFLVRRAVRRVRPVALVVVETELWPGLLHAVRSSGGRVVVANGRISDQSFPRYRRVRWFLRRYLDRVDLFLVQSTLYAKRFVVMGAREERVRVIGSLKFDAPVGAGATCDIPEGREVLVGGSTLEPEEDLLLDAFDKLRRSRPELLLVLAPRQPRRFDEVAELARNRALDVARRSKGDSVTARTEVLVLDTLGELDGLYERADVVFVGGSLATWGGHNIIEPAARGKPVLFGPHMQNFSDVAEAFLEDEAAVQVRNAHELETTIARLFADPARRAELGRRAIAVVERNRGARERTIAALRELIS